MPLLVKYLRNTAIDGKNLQSSCLSTFITTTENGSIVLALTGASVCCAHAHYCLCLIRFARPILILDSQLKPGHFISVWQTERGRSQWPSKAWTVFARLNAGIVRSNPTWGMDACVHLFCVCVVLCVPCDGVIPRSRSPTDCVKRSRNWKAAKIRQMAVEP
jgi:hypothetical protein